LDFAGMTALSECANMFALLKAVTCYGSPRLSKAATCRRTPNDFSAMTKKLVDNEETRE
jgi:hypothetical protein